MSLAISNHKVDSFFQLMKNWDNELKKDLIIKLTKSITNKSENEFDFSKCFGAWQDERTADEIISDIYNNRKNSSKLEDF
ncbi:MAG: hypothetical protein U9N34_07365 [Candidatus Cloacimonadota bacterium]|nr:hypothetical protein [Candidatus Cloacimonadota bacterium]